MRKIYKKLTADQKKRGVVFSSTLSTGKTEIAGDTTHEVLGTDFFGQDKIKKLKDDKFFNNSGWKYNIIRS